MTPPLVPLDTSENIIQFFEDGRCAVVLLPFAPKLTESERQGIDAARRVQFFVYGCSDAPVPPGFSGIGTPEDYPSLQWAISRATYMSPTILQVRQPMWSRQDLVRALLDLDATAGNDDHRRVLTMVTDRPFVGDDEAIFKEGNADA
jgi:hypothetical protein